MHGTSNLDSAIDFYTNAERLFHEASADHGEAVSLLALGIVFQRMRRWTETLNKLQRSLTIFRKLEDKLQADVRDRLMEVRELLERDLANKKYVAPSKVVTSKVVNGRRAGRIIPIVARIAAGEPILAEENIEDYLLLDDEIASQVTFALEVKGDSMIDAGILEKDLVLIEQRNDPPPNRKIVAVIVSPQSNEATLKRFFKEEDHVRLEPENESYPLIIITPETDPETINSLRGRYARDYPKRLVEIYSEKESQIAGWARALIRPDIW